MMKLIIILILIIIISIGVFYLYHNNLSRICNPEHISLLLQRITLIKLEVLFSLCYYLIICE